jgi:ERCC4-related helicase
MSIQDKIDQLIEREIRSVTADIDIEAMLDPKRLRKLIRDEAHRAVVCLVTDAISESFSKQILKSRPIIDALTAEKVQSFLWQIEKLPKEDK